MKPEYAFVVYMLIAIFVAWPVNTGMFYHDAQAGWIEFDQSLPGRGMAAKHQRRDLAGAIAFGAFFSIIWPIQMPLAFLLTAFAEHGVWTQK